MGRYYDDLRPYGPPVPGPGEKPPIESERHRDVMDNYRKTAAAWARRLEDMRALDNRYLGSLIKELEGDLKSLLAMLEREGGGTSPPTGA